MDLVLNYCNQGQKGWHRVVNTAQMVNHILVYLFNYDEMAGLVAPFTTKGTWLPLIKPPKREVVAKKWNELELI